jgi:replication factor C subunit 2/4
MTDKAKHNITKFIETNNQGVRFAFTCNSKNNISTAIQSRCHIINYPKLENTFVIKRLKEICLAEGIYNKKSISEKDMRELDMGIYAISEIADGDLRIAVNTLQLTYDKYGLIDKEKVYGTYDKPHPEQSKDIINACISMDISLTNRLMMGMILKGFSVSDITAGLNLSLRQTICKDIPDYIKITLIQTISYSQYNVSHGLELSHIQARGCVADMCDAILQIYEEDASLITNVQEIIKNNKEKALKNIKNIENKTNKSKSKVKKNKVKKNKVGKDKSKKSKKAIK